ncbi:hypothetical protein NKR23_g785 [Pleurostoma richardsiae]|uniref:Uncharacterized protein n=1 Tax=Pleurostoma richardsiae TaxID=41990 RepID=A0AA38RVV9_9PEZI|nr:hypothetical protein NKR23_g785 [Pleurostoma richardsiae]
MKAQSSSASNPFKLPVRRGWELLWGTSSDRAMTDYSTPGSAETAAQGVGRAAALSRAGNRPTAEHLA